MSALSPLFLWLIPLAFLPVIIHLLNRLRYQTVPWAAMMFLRSADRDASRRAKIRQWIILASRCLMLLMFLLALARLQSKGRLARFFDSGSNLVIILFDRSASMEQLRGGVSGRERAMALLEQGLSELGPGSRVIWMDSATGEMTPLPHGIELDRLPMVSETSTSADISAMLRAALQEIARAGVNKAEVWIPTDRQSSAWLPDGANPPDWSEWAGINTQITLRLLDVAEVVPDSGNRAIQLMEAPLWDGETLTLQMRLLRDTDQPETVPVQIEYGGLSLREEMLVEGHSFTWEQPLQVEAGQSQVHALFSLPADSNLADNRVAVSWVDHGATQASVTVNDVYVDSIMKAALLPQPGLREIVDPVLTPFDQLDFKVAEDGAVLSAAERAWVEQGGVLLLLPPEEALVAVGEGNEGVAVMSWEEQNGVFATEQREPLRLDLVRVYEAVTLNSSAEDTRVLATLENGDPLLVREDVGHGVLYRLATVPDPRSSNLDAGYVLVPMLQRMMMQGAEGNRLSGVQDLGAVVIPETVDWESLDGEGASPLLHTGRYRHELGVLALNRPLQEDRKEELTLSELEDWATPLTFRTFQDHSRVDTDLNSRFEFTSFLSLVGLMFLVVESWLLTRNIRRPSKSTTTWRSAA
ncbi:BatA domain-containing protein [Kiritimatiellota bacterium B12222]|nr:BatA domain-containing protein [Kiritimatiellota bacterium B12222]